MKQAIQIFFRQLFIKLEFRKATWQDAIDRLMKGRDVK